jgi:ribosomal protein S12 methylthiotransferase
MEDVLAEAEQLAAEGCKELVLIAQDVTAYGLDLYGGLKLAALLKELCKIKELHWIRLMYCYEDRITDELIEVMAQEEKICH